MATTPITVLLEMLSKISVLPIDCGNLFALKILSYRSLQTPYPPNSSSNSKLADKKCGPSLSKGFPTALLITIAPTV